MELRPAVPDIAKTQVFIACVAAVNSPYFGFRSPNFFAECLRKLLSILPHIGLPHPERAEPTATARPFRR
jgi:hypothetical protein